MMLASGSSKFVMGFDGIAVNAFPEKEDNALHW